jgi:hypothetical protein
MPGQSYFFKNLLLMKCFNIIIHVDFAPEYMREKIRNE